MRTSKSGNSGAITAGSGEVTGGRAGIGTLAVGSGTSGAGGSMQSFAGRSTVVTGGAVSLSSGEGTATTSGIVTIRSMGAGDNGVSGVQWWFGGDSVDSGSSARRHHSRSRRILGENSGAGGLRANTAQVRARKPSAKQSA